MDFVLLIPNGLGAVLGFIQMFLCLIAPRKEMLVSGETDQGGEDLVNIDDEEGAGVETTDLEATDEESNHAAASSEKDQGN